MVPVRLREEPVPSEQSTPASFTPALGKDSLTPLYDLAIALLTRERLWRGLLVRQIAPSPGDRILDVGCGTGTLAVMLARKTPGAAVTGIDPDPAVLQRARAKAAAASVSIAFVEGFLGEEGLAPLKPLSKITSSLVLHQVPLSEKRRMLALMRNGLIKGGTLHIADYGEQKTGLSRWLFRHTVQSLDGIKDTQPNADGILPVLMRDVGFDQVEEMQRVGTPTGVISIYRAVAN